MWDKLLDRINFNGELIPDQATLFELHECHVRAVPFENQDVQNHVEIQLDLSHLFQKVVTNRRGGFCYELNYLFYQFLKYTGFAVEMISARTYDEEALGPEFDHLALMISLKEKLWLADVGFGDLFVIPIEIVANKVQFDGRHYFKLEQTAKTWLLLMSKDGKQYEKKYQFNTRPRDISEFEDQCRWKQYDPESYFVRNSIATLPTPRGRKSIFNEKFIVKEEGKRNDEEVKGNDHLIEILRKEFGIHLKG